MAASITFWVVGMLMAPLFMGIIVRTKAVLAGRRGAPLLQLYFDIAKLLQKGAVYSRTTTFVFLAGPIIGLAAVIVASLLIPVGGVPAPVSFSGDLILLAYLLGLMRFMTVLSALDTGSSFEGMGASREVWLSVLAEPALFLSFAALARLTGSISLSGIMAALSTSAWHASIAVLLLICVALMIVILTENARIPVDDPNTHLELTMIHEVMVLDHGGVDLGYIEYASSLKFWVTGMILVNVMLPVRTGSPWINGLCGVIGLAILAVVIGLVESSMARLRLRRVPQFLIGAIAFAAIALILALGGD